MNQGKTREWEKREEKWKRERNVEVGIQGDNMSRRLKTRGLENGGGKTYIDQENAMEWEEKEETKEKGMRRERRNRGKENEI